jgi:glucosamine-6-phosphate deaminase
MQLITLPNEELVDEVAALAVATVIRTQPNSSIVPAAGNTPMGTYRCLAAMRRQGALETKDLRIFQLDAYLGLAPDDPRSLRGWIRTTFLDPLDIDPENFTALPGDAGDPLRACRTYHDAVLRAGGFDLAILGLGPNGHLGFNEPPSTSGATTRIVSLTPESVRSNAVYWGDEDRVPKQALTAGLDLLLASRQILLIVKGAHKRKILHATLYGAIDPAVPASFLQKRPDVTVVADRAAVER